MGVKRRGGITRRQFIGAVGGGVGAGLVAGPLLLDLAGCGDGTTGAQPMQSDEVLLGLYRRSEVSTGEAAMRTALDRIDLSWLKAGESVLVKLACNSANAHPAVTSPSAVRGLCARLRELGAGRIVVADQSGVESVRLAPGERRFSSTRDVARANGLLQAITDAGAEPHFFDDQGFDAGYFEATPPAGCHWTRPLMLPNIVKQVDHIVYLPRLGSHILCGYTIGHKSAIGFLRDDSRHHLHYDATAIYEKYVEVSYVPEIRDRFRLALTLAESMLLHNGPDKGTVTVADPMIVVASDNLACHDAVAAGLLVYFNGVTPAGQNGQYNPATANAINQVFVSSSVEAETGIPWGPANPGTYQAYAAHHFEDGLDGDRAIARAFEIQGKAPNVIRVVGAGAPLAAEVRSALASHGGGRFSFT